MAETICRYTGVFSRLSILMSIASTSALSRVFRLLPVILIEADLKAAVEQLAPPVGGPAEELVLGALVCGDNEHGPGRIAAQEAGQARVEPVHFLLLADPLSVRRVGDDDTALFSLCLKLRCVADGKADRILYAGFDSVFSGGGNRLRIDV